MRGFTGGMVVLGLVVGCSVPGLGELGGCVSDEDCGPSGVCTQINGGGLCRKKPDVFDPSECSNACLAYEACTTEGCLPRFSAVTIKEPSSGASLNGGTIPIVVELTEKYVTETEWPVLVFTATRKDGSPAGSIPTPTRNGNQYTALWTMPNLDEEVTVTAAYAGASPSATVVVDVDTLAPTFTLGFSTPPIREQGDTGAQAAQQDPTAGYESAFRRDETVTVTVSSNDNTVTQAQLTVVGIGLGGTPGRTEASVTVDMQPRTSCPGGQPVCGEKAVDLAVPEMSDFRGTMVFRAKGQDRAGNEGQSAELPLRVTRWKWAFDAAGRIEGTPALGNQGLIYFGTNSGSRFGKTYGVDWAGSKKWVFDSGDVTGSVAVGALKGIEEYVYVAARGASNSWLYALNNSGTEKARCTYAGSIEGPSAIAVETVGGLETATTVYNSSQVRIGSLSPESTPARCLEITSPSVPRAIAGAVVVKDQNVFYGTSNATLTSYDISTGANTARPGWPQSFPVASPGLAVAGENIYVGAGSVGAPSQGGLAKISVNGGSVETLFPASGGARVFNVSIDGGDTAYFGAETSSSKDLRSLQLGIGTPSAVVSSGVGILRGAPVVGRGGNLYTVNTDGEVRAWTPGSATPLWGTKIEPGAGEATNISPTLDCLRDASGQAVTSSRLGVLYVTAETKVHAFIVDSPGLDPDAPWPKYQHDARNTGNPATPILRCP
ncbi:Outer membrane protein assembly factor BamB, contains PQQ-like beta-propeller repeat [Stigmatella aurantiaca]|uniref:Outer membrane protein assembly factor BamB, contains PQQ-like beta-propeller repeat n=1 Tax=Stigmatella aurantiaca TaxID=41 RepID=A0A1H7LZT6_STIAU|nr:PQQ-binding-like beta-propeller repeat protein [Stigmatella aurantiaca]SEL04359.1 Outer membrane protein assembly factor BamB, contains PQQ-like beta-propeller repeat [Stigmatella aurantiaca]